MGLVSRLHKLLQGWVCERLSSEWETTGLHIWPFVWFHSVTRVTPVGSQSIYLFKKINPLSSLTLAGSLIIHAKIPADRRTSRAALCLFSLLLRDLSVYPFSFSFVFTLPTASSGCVLLCYFLTSFLAFCLHPFTLFLLSCLLLA